MKPIICQSPCSLSKSVDAISIECNGDENRGRIKTNIRQQNNNYLGRNIIDHIRRKHIETKFHFLEIE